MANQTDEEFENLKNISKHGGARDGAGRPKGKMNQTSIERSEVKKAFQEKVATHAERLFAAQMNIAEGATMLFKVEKDSKGNNKKPELVTDQYTVQRFIEECGGYDGQMDGDTYYFLTTKLPDNRAIDSMLDRAFGKPESNLDLTTNGKDLAPVLVKFIGDNDSKDN